MSALFGAFQFWQYSILVTWRSWYIFRYWDSRNQTSKGVGGGLEGKRFIWLGARTKGINIRIGKLKNCLAMLHAFDFNFNWIPGDVTGSLMEKMCLDSGRCGQCSDVSEDSVGSSGSMHQPGVIIHFFFFESVI